MNPGEEVVVTALPLYHIFALTVNLIVYFSIGAENWLIANARNLDGVIDVFKAARPTSFMGVNTLYAGLVAHPRIGEADFRGCGSRAVAARRSFPRCPNAGRP